jgi:hypothetical protein
MAEPNTSQERWNTSILATFRRAGATNRPRIGRTLKEKLKLLSHPVVGGSHFQFKAL